MFKLFQCVLIFLTAVHTYGFDLRLNYSSSPSNTLWFEREMLIITSEWSTHTKNITQELINTYNLKVTKDKQIHDNNTGYELISFIEEMVLEYNGPYWFNDKIYSITFNGFSGENFRSAFRIKGRKWFNRDVFFGSKNSYFASYYRVDSLEHMRYRLGKMIPNLKEIQAVHTYGFDLRLNYSSSPSNSLWFEREMLIISSEWSTHTKNITQELIKDYNYGLTKNQQIHDNNTGYELISFIQEIDLECYGPSYGNDKFYSITFTGFAGEQPRSTFRIKGRYRVFRDIYTGPGPFHLDYRAESLEHMTYVLNKMS